MDDNIRGFPGYHITKEGKIKELHVKGISAREIRNKYFPNVCEETIRRTINQCLI